jgi:hypothetical protein
MKVYVFSSSNLTNIWAGIGARMWAVAETQAANPSIASRARNLPLGAFGMFWCVETQSLTVPFVTRSRPEPEVIVSNVWPEPWRLPFQILPLGSPRNQLSKDELTVRLPALAASGRGWHDVFHVSPSTVFAASDIDDRDWQVLIELLADA